MKTLLTLSFIVLAHVCFTQTQLIDDMLETWDKHTEMNSLLLSGIKKEFLRDTSSSGGRNVVDQFAHMHNVRMMWLTQLTPNVGGVDEEIDSVESLQISKLSEALINSNQLIRIVLKMGLEKGADSWPMSPTRFMAYLISHESHVRGQIMLAFKQSGHPMPPNIAYGIWDW